ncbi:MAG: hypothetical protein M3O36_08585 [Myxococcota bacterium]|nr:hypothetical protein [Myxococcota bacterium]
MSEDKPSPLKDAVKGVGLLFRAAKNVAARLPTRLPTKGLEDAMLTSAREVGRAIENVAAHIDKELFGQAVFGKNDTGKNKSGAPHGASPPVTAVPNPAPLEPPAPKPPDAA